MAFHWKDGWYFERIDKTASGEFGVVRIFHIEPGETIADVDIEIDGNSWASIMASVSGQGESGYTHRLASAFHQTVG